MSYYADWRGVLYLKNNLSKEAVERAQTIICENTEIDDVEYITGVVSSKYDNNRMDLNCAMITVRGYEVYFEKEWESMLDRLAFYINEDSALVSQIEFIGDDKSLWRFIFEEGRWLNQNGHVQYE